MTNQDAPDRRFELLLVEDNPGDVRLAEEALEDDRITSDLHVVTSGSEALDFLHRRGEYVDAPRPNLILLDVSLPCVDGTEVLEEIRASPAVSDIPVVLLTNSAAEEEFIRRDETRATAYLTKPVDPDDLLDLEPTIPDG